MERNIASCEGTPSVSRYTYGEALLPALSRTGTNLHPDRPRTSRAASEGLLTDILDSAAIHIYRYA
ncbi:hypothetical protein D3C85_1668360 [compost metagenome]